MSSHSYSYKVVSTGGSSSTSTTFFSSESSSSGGTFTMIPTSRYSVGWGVPDQLDRKLTTRVSRIQSQNFQEIRDQCLSEGTLFEDPNFPADNSSLFFSHVPGRNFEWKRPPEICQDPHMFVGGTSRFDVCQGDLGNCWFLASVASLCASGNQCGNKTLMNRLVPPDNSFSENYAGVVHFKIWQYGKWVDVIIDDKLPTLDGKLVYMHSAQSNEFWSALLEKAYAKLNGSYESLAAGCATEAMEDFTGGVAETFDFKKGIPKNLFKIALKAFQRCSLMGCTIDATAGTIENVLDNGLVIGHAYSITSVKELQVGSNAVHLLRIRNPWGNQYEWKGAWSDQSAEWQQISEEDRQRCGITFDDDGEFWMEWNDFTANFHKLEICNLTPDPITEEIAQTSRASAWSTTTVGGAWRQKVNAGGCRNFLDTFWTNPQYRVEIADPDPEDDDDVGGVIVALMQKERRKKKSEGIGYLTMGYSIYKLPEGADGGPLDLQFFKFNAATARSPTFSNLREICGRHRLPPGHYVVLPCTFKPDQEGEFMVRIFTESHASSSELDEKTELMPEEDEKSLDELKDPTKWKPGDSAPQPPVKFEARRRRLRSTQVTEDDVTEERQARVMFRKGAGEDLELDPYELRTLMNNTFMSEFKFDGFSLETCRSMVAMMDVDKSGKLGYEEFKTLWQSLRKWKKIFKEFDADNSGNLCSYELRQALNSASIRVSNSTLNALVMRYSDQNGKIGFDDFILCAIRVRTMFDIWHEMCKDNKTGPAAFNLDEFVQTTMYS